MVRGSGGSVPPKLRELHPERGSRVNYLTVKSDLKPQIEEEYNKNIYQETAVAWSSPNPSKLWSLKIRVNTFLSPLFSHKVFGYNSGSWRF